MKGGCFEIKTILESNLFYRFFEKYYLPIRFTVVGREELLHYNRSRITSKANLSEKPSIINFNYFKFGQTA